MARFRRAARRLHGVCHPSAASQRRRHQFRLAGVRHRGASDRLGPRSPLRLRHPDASSTPGDWRPGPGDPWHRGHPSVPRAGVGRPAGGAIRCFGHRSRRKALDPVRACLPGGGSLFRHQAPTADRDPPRLRGGSDRLSSAERPTRPQRRPAARCRPFFVVKGVSGPACAGPTVAGIALVLLLARRRRHDLSAAASVVIAGGVLASHHALPADFVLVALALALWGQAKWFDWLGLSVAAFICALTPAPVPALVGVLVIGWVCLRAAGLVVTWTPREQAPASAR